jgi:hypothetical protein
VVDERLQCDTENVGFARSPLLGKFRTSTKTVTITNTSSLCGYLRQHRVVIFSRFAGVNEDRLPFSYVPNEQDFFHFLRFVDILQYNLIIWVLWNRYIHVCILSMGLCLIDANNLLNRAVIFVLIQLKPVLYAERKRKWKIKIWWRVRTSTNTITITNTSSLCGYVHPNQDVISRHFVQTSLWHSKLTWFCWFASICGHFPFANAMPFDWKRTNDVFNIVIVFVMMRNLPLGYIDTNAVRGSSTLLCTLTWVGLATPVGGASIVFPWEYPPCQRPLDKRNSRRVELHRSYMRCLMHRSEDICRWLKPCKTQTWTKVTRKNRLALKGLSRKNTFAWSNF